jgi:hypothetical protein
MLNYYNKYIKYKKKYINLKGGMPPNRRIPNIIWSLWINFDNLDGDQVLDDSIMFFVENIKRLHPEPLWAYNIIQSLKDIEKFLEEYEDIEIIKIIMMDKNIKPAHKSDFIRFILLKYYGGYWLDITTFIVAPLDEIIPDYYNIGEFSNLQGFTLRNKKTNEAISIGATNALGDFDEEIYDSSRLTLKDIRTKVYPLTEDVRYKEWFLKYDALRTAKKRISDMSKPVVESGFGKPRDFDFPEK